MGSQPRIVEGHSLASIRIVVVPSEGLIHPGQWNTGSTNWLDNITSNIAPQAKVWTWEYSEQGTDLGFSQRLDYESHWLLEALCVSYEGKVRRSSICV